MQWLGDVSYAVYLWHWPLIALGPFVLGRDLMWVDKVAILVITGVLAHLTRAFVEQPFIKGFPSLVGTPLRTLVSTLTAMAIIAGAAFGYGAWMDRSGRAALQDRLAEMAADPCLGATASLDPGLCGSPFDPAPRAAVTEADSPWEMPACDPECWIGERPDRVMVVVGDSHAQTLYHALLPLAEARGTGWRSSCRAPARSTSGDATSGRAPRASPPNAGAGAPTCWAASGRFSRT
ncbi:acyltransferase [Propioniciclava coleopterorum]|uniref:Acyltransferase n=1 Tax=Propioniciclava coleopterorum TaxID=2714937 RepID=A0A6G7Y8Q9_9ACTN|nr:acyltransferase [Propioniciclava coleopterorum]